MWRQCCKDSKDIAFIRLRHAFFSPNSVATLRVLTVAVKARCSFEVVSSVSGKFGNPYSILQHKSSFIFRFRWKSRTKWCPCLFRRAPFTRTPHSFFELCPFCVQAWRFWDILKSKTSFCVTGAGHLTPFHPCGRRGTFCALLKRWQVWVKIRCGFGGHFAGQAQYLVCMDDVLKGSKASFCETVVIFDFGHDDDSMWQVRHLG